MKGVLIVGSGSQARYVVDTLREDGRGIVGMLDVESTDNVGKAVAGVPILGLVDDAERLVAPGDVHVVVAYGDNRRKRDLVQRLGRRGYAFASAVSRHAYVSPSATIGEGAIVNPRAVVMPDARVGAHVILHSNAVVEHDCVVGDYANLAPGACLAGRVEVGEGAYVYTGASVVPKRRIGAWAVVGAGAVVVDDVPAGATVVGVPARVVRPGPGGGSA